LFKFYWKIILNTFDHKIVGKLVKKDYLLFLRDVCFRPKEFEDVHEEENKDERLEDDMMPPSESSEEEEEEEVTSVPHDNKFSE
jgi:hypothetical protein